MQLWQQMAGRAVSLWLTPGTLLSPSVERSITHCGYYQRHGISGAILTSSSIHVIIAAHTVVWKAVLFYGCDLFIYSFLPA